MNRHYLCFIMSFFAFFVEAGIKKIYTVQNFASAYSSDNMATGIRTYFYIIADNRASVKCFDFDISKLYAEINETQYKLNSEKVHFANMMGYLKGFYPVNIIPAGQICAGIIWFDRSFDKQKMDTEIKLFYDKELVSKYFASDKCPIMSAVYGFAYIFYVYPPVNAPAGNIGAVGAWKLSCRQYEKTIKYIDIENSVLNFNVISYYMEPLSDKEINIFVAIYIPNNKDIRGKLHSEKDNIVKGAKIDFIRNVSIRLKKGISYSASSPEIIVSNYAGVLRGFGSPSYLFVNNRDYEFGILKFTVPVEYAGDIKDSVLMFRGKEMPLCNEVKKEDASFLLPSGVYGTDARER